MSSRLSARKWLLELGLAFATPIFVFGENSLTNLGAEYRIMPSLPGEQSLPAVALRSNGGYLVWQDNLGDANGTPGISARRLTSNFSGDFGYFRVNQTLEGEQSNPQVSLLANGGAAFFWEGGQIGYHHVYARFLAPNGTFVTGEVQVNSSGDGAQLNPAVASLSDGNIGVVWNGNDGSLTGVSLQRLSPAGEKIGAEVRVNQFTNFNQRSPAIAALNNGNFVVAWITEQQRFINSVDLFVRVFNNAGVPLGQEFRANTGTNTCSQPAVTPAVDGGFLVTWVEQNSLVITNGLDILLRAYSFAGLPMGNPVLVNSHTYGDQYTPRVASVGANHLIIWTSLGQDGSWEGVYARGFNSAGEFTSLETKVNSTVVSRQMQPAVAGDPSGRFLVVWTSFVGGSGVYDLFAQRFSTSPSSVLLPAPAAPHVFALDYNTLSATWPELQGYALAGYEVYLDAATTPLFVTDNFFKFTDLAASSTHNVRLAYVLQDGRRSALSAVATGTTWGQDWNFDDLPDNWQELYFSQSGSWPSKNADSDSDGASNYEEFLAGTDPNDAASVLKTQLSPSEKGMHLSWNTQAGMIYQVQKSMDFVTWSAAGSPRFAVGSNDSVLLESSAGNNYYRVIRLR